MGIAFDPLESVQSTLSACYSKASLPQAYTHVEVGKGVTK